jgi:hypothetical protein
MPMCHGRASSLVARRGVKLCSEDQRRRHRIQQIGQRGVIGGVKRASRASRAASSSALPGMACRR